MDFYTKDKIVRDVSDRLSIPKEKVEYVIDFLIVYVEKISKARHIVGIIFPFLGTMYLKTTQIKKEIGKLESHKKKRKLTRIESINLSKLKTKLDSVQKDYKPGQSKNKNHYRKNKLKNKYLTEGRTLEELEIWQNEEER